MHWVLSKEYGLCHQYLIIMKFFFFWKIHDNIESSVILSRHISLKAIFPYISLEKILTQTEKKNCLVSMQFKIIYF